MHIYIEFNKRPTFPAKLPYIYNAFTVMKYFSQSNWLIVR